MAYSGSQHVIKLGQIGLISDVASDAMPDGSLIRCENTQFLRGIAEKADEITDWVFGNPSYQTPQFTNEKPLGVHRYFPIPKTERQCVVTDAGNVYKFDSPFLRTLVTPDPLSIDTPSTLSLSGNPVIITGGNEVQGNPKKVFVFTGNSQVQVIEGDGAIRRNIKVPAADWTTPTDGKSVSYPTFGLIFRSKLFTFGNISNPHMVYGSDSTDQENFNAITPGVLAIPCFPGEGEGIVSAFIYKTKLFVFKKPYGIYGLVDNDTDPNNWYFQKVSSSFGIASQMSFFEASDDFFVLSNDGTVMSMTAALRLGDIYSSNVLAAAYSAQFFRKTIRNQYLSNAFGCYLPKKKIGVFAFPSYTSIDGYCDSLIYIDLNGQSPRVSWHRYLNTSFTACNYFKDAYGDDQFLFSKLKFSSKVYTTGCLATYFPHYTANTPFRIQTSESNLGVEANKDFDGFELIFESTSVYPVAVDVYVDSKYSESFLIQPFYGGALGPALMTGGKFANPIFTLDSSASSGRGTRPKWNSLHARGQTISFSIRDGNTINSPYTGPMNKDDGNGGTYPVRIAGIRVYYRVAGQDQKAQSS
jgi:hypothetical protein